MNKKFMTQINKRVTALALALMMVISLLPMNGLSVSADEVNTDPQNASTITANNLTISENGTYQLAENLTGKIIIAEGVTEVTIIGNGAEWEKDMSSENYGAVTSPANEELKIDCTKATGITLTLKDMYIKNEYINDNSIDFAGVGNTLIFDGTVVIDHDNNAQGYAGIHVKKGDELTIYGTTGSSFYMYKREQAAGIGANNQEPCGTINLGEEDGANDFYFYMKGTKQGAVIGNGANCPDTPGDINVYSGIYNLEANARGALLGGSAGPSSFDAGNVYIKGGLLNLNVDFSGAAIGGGGFATGNDKEGGNVYLTGGSVRTYIDTNAVSSWSSYGVTEAGVNDVAITANKLNADGEAVYMLPIDTAGMDADTYTVTLDSETYYVGPRYAYCYCYENTDRDQSNDVYPNGTPGNWIPLTSETKLYLYATAEDHVVTVNDVTYVCTWNEDAGTFDVHKHDYVLGKCECGTVEAGYEWYYSHEEGTNYTLDTAEELAALATFVNSGFTFVGETVELTANIDLASIDNWTPIGGSTTKVDLTLTSNEDLKAALQEHAIIYDSAGASYVPNSDKNGVYDANRTYYYIKGGCFEGTFDGNEYTVSNMTVDTNVGYCGLFGYVTGTVKDLTVVGSVTTTTNMDFVGGVVGKVSEHGVISGVTSKVDVTAKSAYNIGGVVGFVGEPGVKMSEDNEAVVEKCVNYGSVTGCVRTGGIAGRNAGIVRECINYGKVFNQSGAKKGTGGIVGMNGVNNFPAADYGIVENCVNAGSVHANNGYWTGGIVGFQNELSSAKNCYNIGELVHREGSTATISWTNPGVGCNEGKAENIFGIDTVKGKDATPVGNQGGTATNCVYKTEGEMKSEAFALELGDAFYYAGEEVNGGYPVFAYTISLTDEMEAAILTEIESLYTEKMKSGLYREEQKPELTKAYEAAEAALPETTTLKEARDVRATAVAAMEAVKTNEQLTGEETAVTTAMETINALEEITLADKETIEAARAAYDALTDGQKANIDSDTYKAFLVSERVLKALESEVAAAESKAAAEAAQAEAEAAQAAAETAKAEAEAAKKAAADAQEAAEEDKAAAEAAQAAAIEAQEKAEAAKAEAEAAKKAAADAQAAAEEAQAKAEKAAEDVAADKKAAEEAKAEAEAAKQAAEDAKKAAEEAEAAAKAEAEAAAKAKAEAEVAQAAAKAEAEAAAKAKAEAEAAKKAAEAAQAKAEAAKQAAIVASIGETDLTAKNESNTSIKLTWSKLAGTDGYVIWRAVKGGEFEKIKTIETNKTTSYTNKSLKCGTTYVYKIQAYKNVDGEVVYGEMSDEVELKAKPVATKITSIKKAKKKLTLKWKKVSGASGYVIYRSTKKNGTYKKVKTIKKASTVKWTNSKLKSKKTYYYKIRAYKTVNGKKVYSSYSAIKSAKTK